MNKKLLVTSILVIISSILIVSYIQFDSWRYDLSIETVLPKYMPSSEEEIKNLSPENTKKLTNMFIHQYAFTENLLKEMISVQKAYVLWLSALSLFLSVIIILLVL